MRCCRDLSYQFISCFSCHCFEIGQVHLHFNYYEMDLKLLMFIIYENEKPISFSLKIQFLREKIGSE